MFALLSVFTLQGLGGEQLSGGKCSPVLGVSARISLSTLLGLGVELAECPVFHLLLFSCSASIDMTGKREIVVVRSGDPERNCALYVAKAWFLYSLAFSS